MLQQMADTMAYRIPGFARAAFSVPALTDLPNDILPRHRELFLESLKARTIAELVAAFRYWEGVLLPAYSTEPFFLVRTADIRACLNSSATALSLYRKAKSLLPETDTVFDEFVEEFVQQCIREEEHHKSIWSQGTFNQPWKSTSKFLFPIIPMVPRGMPDLQRRWTTMKDGPHVQQYARYLCIETNILEQTFMLDTQSITQLIRVGYVDQDAAFADDSKLQDKYLITSILRDTHQALDMIWEVANDTEKLTTDFLVKLHGTCLKNSCILPLKAREDGDTQELKYTNVGVTREECRKNVVLPGPPRVQFAPLERVVDEMNRICHLARQWLKNWTRNPFATSAWLHLVFVSCHPFEDGNGRVARLLASIPLIKAGLPPLCIPAIARKSYYDGINKARGGNYELLISCFVRALEASISAIEDLENDPSAMTVI